MQTESLLEDSIENGKCNLVLLLTTLEVCYLWIFIVDIAVFVNRQVSNVEFLCVFFSAYKVLCDVGDSFVVILHALVE